MRKNLPVTGKEISLSDSTTIVSMTNDRGVIRSVNRDFLEISGFPMSELAGAPHNVVRHPDMPPAAFADLWACLKSGRPWVGMVKNRCKNGDHYWVEANATPCYENRQLTGYMSVRRKASAEAIAAAERAYAEVNAGKSGIGISRGRVVSTTLLGRLGRALAAGYRQKILAFGASGTIAGLVAAYLVGPSNVGVVPAMLGLLAFGSAAMALLYRTVRGLERRTDLVARAVHDMANGDYSSRIETTCDDALGRLAQEIKSIQIKLGFELQQLAIDNEENLRIRNALDSVRTNVMIADSERRVVYLNPAVQKLLKEAEGDIRQVIRDFDAGQVLGGSIDRFHVKPERQVRILDALTGTHEARLRFGARVFSLLINPVSGADGRRIATVVEWQDVTVEDQVDAEVTAIVNAAARGVFGSRIRTDDKQGFLHGLSTSVNGLLDTTATSLAEVRRVLGALAQGDLTQRIDRPLEGEFGEIQRDANRTVAQLARIVEDIRRGSDAINVAAGEIASGNSDLSRRTEQQAANLEETAASMEELTSTVRQNAESARQANQLAIGAASVASQGGEVVGKVVTTMTDIEQSSKKIAEIISVIDGIAFQTNILALNAAVEAARAGEQGRGFAVVASEVRTLAQRSANAAKEIKGLIETSVDKVADGSALVNQAGATMGEIVASVQRVTDIMAEISAASQEQSAGIEQVNQTIVQMDETTQQNAALVEEASASARSMEEQALSLKRAVSVFQIDESQPVLRNVQMRLVPTPV